MNHYEYGDHSIGYIGNVSVMLERGESQQNNSQQTESDVETIETMKTIETTTTDDMWHKMNYKILGERDPLLNKERQRQVELHNRFEMLECDDDDDDTLTDIDNDSDIDGDSDCNRMTRRR